LKAGKSNMDNMFPWYVKPVALMAFTHFVVWPFIRDSLWDRPATSAPDLPWTVTVF